MNINHASHGLRPWLAADAVVKNHDGGTTIEAVDLPSLDEAADISISYQMGNLLPPDGGETPAGTTIEHDTIREFRIHVEECDDQGGLRDVNYHIRPRWHDLKAETNAGETVTIPDGGLTSPQTDGVSIAARGSNIPFEKYNQLLREASDALGISPRYFGDGPFDVHETSNIQDAARYVRTHEDASGPIHGRDGPLVGLSHVLEDDRDGYRKIVQDDADKRGEKKPGFYHTVTLGPKRVREVWPDHQLPIELKHYYKKDYHARTDGLAHPKLEAAYQTSRTEETFRYDAETVEQIRRELDEALYAVLHDAGLDLRAGGSTYVGDEIFTASNALTDATIVNLDLTEIRHEQHAVVYKHLVRGGGLSPIEREAVGTLVTDGGEVSPADIADEHDRNLDAVYRALGRMDDLIEREYGRVSLRSTYVAELVHDAIQQAEAAVSRATEAAAETLEAADRGLDEKTSAFIAWCESHDLNFRETGDSVSVKLGQIDSDTHDPYDTPDAHETVKAARRKAREILREGRKLWASMNRDETRFRSGSWSASVEVPTDEAALRSTDINDTRTQHLGGDIWKTLG